MPEIAIFAVYYLGWFAAVLLAKTNFAWAALACPLALAAFLVLRRGVRPQLTFAGLAITATGVLFDSLATHYGLISFHGDDFWLLPDWMAPVWLVAIWLLFSFSMIGLRSALSFSYPLAAFLGALMGPLSYRSGEYFDVLKMSSSLALIVYAVFWAIAFPAILFILRRFG